VRAQQVDLFDRQAGLVGDLVQRRLFAELDRQLTLRALDLAGALGDMSGQADGTAGVVKAALQSLADPNRGVCREAEPLAPVELLSRTNEAEHALLNEVIHRQALALVLPGHRHDQPQVAVDQAFLRREVTALDPLRQLDFLVRLEQAEATGFAQELLKRLEEDLVWFKQRARGGDAVQYLPLFDGELERDVGKARH